MSELGCARVRELWDALSRGELEPLASALTADARWRAVVEGPWNCEDRASILATMRELRARGALAGTIEDAFEDGEHVLVAFRPDDPHPGGWPLEDGLRWVVLTRSGERISELKGCATRADALTHARRPAGD